MMSMIWESSHDPQAEWERRLTRAGHARTCLAVQEGMGYPCDCGRGWERRSPGLQLRVRLARLWARLRKPGAWTETDRQRVLQKINKL